MCAPPPPQRGRGGSALGAAIDHFMVRHAHVLARERHACGFGHVGSLVILTCKGAYVREIVEPHDRGKLGLAASLAPQQVDVTARNPARFDRGYHVAAHHRFICAGVRGRGLAAPDAADQASPASARRLASGRAP